MDKLTPAQIREWEAYDKIDPIGSWRMDFQTARLMSHMTNIVNALYCEKGKQPEKTTVKDYLINWETIYDPAPEPDTVSLRESLLAWAESHNKAYDRRKAEEEALEEQLKRPPSKFRDSNKNTETK